jgi:predicted secreted hydrolase
MTRFKSIFSQTSLVLFYATWLLVPLFNLYSQSFVAADPGFKLRYPADHGQHSEFQTEWWYYTGQLYEDGVTPFEGRPVFGFQLTFFRRGVSSTDGVQQEYMAHAAITDIAHGQTIFASRVGGGAVGLSGVASSSLGAWSGDWSVDPIGDSLVLRFSIAGRQEKRSLHLRILANALPQPWLQGQNGFSKKAECAGCASMYYSLPRLDLKATYREGRDERNLRGIGWMDHEFMTNSLGPKQQGWDWMGLMLKDGRNLMLFKVRGAGGDGDTFISGGVGSSAGTRVLTKNDFTVTPVNTWQSPRTKARYPIEWRIQIPSEGLDTTVRARVLDAEIGASDGAEKTDAVGAVTYWEGPVASSNETVIGYLEMTGYSGKVSM